VVEDCFVRLWEKRELIESANAVKPYLYTSVRNRCLDVLRKQGHSKIYEAHLKRAPEEFAPDHVQAIIVAESMFQVYLAVEKLPGKYKRVFDMFYLHGRELMDIASELDLPLATVKSRKKRTLEILRAQLPHLGFFILLFFFS
jgi:RNA polymerase sigma-70 factor (ECF subfamily)